MATFSVKYKDLSVRNVYGKRSIGRDSAKNRATGNSRFKTAKFPREVKIFPRLPVIEITTLHHQVSNILYD